MGEKILWCRFELYAIASDETGSMMIILEEREVKKLIAKTVSDITDEVISQ